MLCNISAFHFYIAEQSRSIALYLLILLHKQRDENTCSFFTKSMITTNYITDTVFCIKIMLINALIFSL
jgi:hypothetical protein